MYINIHSHYSGSGKGHIQNVIVKDRDQLAGIMASLGQDSCLSAGIHPWYIDEEHTGAQFELLSQLAKDPRVKLIGECGLDRLRGPEPGLQFRVFEAQIRLAVQLDKPVVIHCVRYFSELISVKKRMPEMPAAIVHGFNNKPEIAEQLLKHGFYLSFGAALLEEGPNASSVIGRIPHDRIFLETDDTQLPVERIYDSAASLLNISVNRLKEIIFATWLNL